MCKVGLDSVPIPQFAVYHNPFFDPFPNPFRVLVLSSCPGYSSVGYPQQIHCTLRTIRVSYLYCHAWDVNFGQITVYWNSDDRVLRKWSISTECLLLPIVITLSVWVSSSQLYCFIKYKSHSSSFLCNYVHVAAISSCTSQNSTSENPYLVRSSSQYKSSSLGELNHRFSASWLRSSRNKLFLWA